MKNIPKIESKIIIGYSNFPNLLSIIKALDELRTNKLEISIKILKKFEKASLEKLSRNIFSELLELLNIIAIVTRIIIELKLKTRLKLFLIKTPIIKAEKIDIVKNISGSNIFKLFIINLILLIELLSHNYLSNYLQKNLQYPLMEQDKNQNKLLVNLKELTSMSLIY